jgi:preprotein translocase subunit SecE
MKKLGTFLWEVKHELSRVVWPSRNEFLGAVVVVLITMVAFGIFLGIVNYVFYMAFLKGFQLIVFGR